MTDKNKLIDMLTEIKGIVEYYATIPEGVRKNIELGRKPIIVKPIQQLPTLDESLCDDCEWFKNPGACPDYDESKCRYNAPMEEE